MVDILTQKRQNESLAISFESYFGVDLEMNKLVVNSGRQRELDWAKTFAIIFMITIHVYEQLSVIDIETVPTGAFRIAMEFLAGPLAAPLFMFCMGIGIVYSRNNTPDKMALRGVKLMRNGYLLSFFKGTLPTAIGMMLGCAVPWTLTDSFFLVSILQFAGMAFFTIALMKKLKFPLPVMFGTSIVLSILGGMLAKLDFTGSWLQYLLGLFFNTNNYTTFPMFRWLYYPVLGMVFAYFLQRTTDKNKFYGRMFPVALTLFIAVNFIYSAVGIDVRTMFQLAGRVYYAQSLLHHLYITLVILTALPVYYLLSVKVKNEKVNAVVEYLSKNLDVIYIWQWMVNTYTQSFMTLFGVPNLTEPYIIPAGIAILLASVGIIELWRKITKKNSKKKESLELAV